MKIYSIDIQTKGYIIGCFNKREKWHLHRIQEPLNNERIVSSPVRPNTALPIHSIHNERDDLAQLLAPSSQLLALSSQLVAHSFNSTSTSILFHLVALILDIQIQVDLVVMTVSLGTCGRTGPCRRSAGFTRR